MATLSPTSASTPQDPASVNGPTPQGSWPSTQEDGSDLPSLPSATETSLPSTHSNISTSTLLDESSIIDDKGSQKQPDQPRTRKVRPHRGRYEPSHPTYYTTREQLREIADVTLNKLDSGFYVPPPFKSRAQAQEEAKIKAAEEAEAEARARARAKEEEEQKEKEKEKAEIPSASDPQSIASNPSVEGQVPDVKRDDSESQDTQGSDGRNDEEEKETKEPIYSYAYDLVSKVAYTNSQTEFYASDDPFISNWSSIASGSAVSEGAASDSPRNCSSTKTRIFIREYSTLVGARRLHALNRRKREKDVGRDVSGSAEKIGVLNFASAKKPGGGFLSGAQAQEESLARSSTLFPSLITATSSPFYDHYQENKDSPTIAYYTHAMIYSPSVVLFRNDKGLWLSPLEVDILTSAAVNAGEVRERVRYEEELREIRERWEQIVAERRKIEEEERRKEQEEWEGVLKDNEELKRRYGDGDSGSASGENETRPMQDITGSSSEVGLADVEEVKGHQVGITSGSSETNATPTPLPSTQVNEQSAEESTSSETQAKEKAPAPEFPSSSVCTDSTIAADPVDLPSEPKPDPMALAEIEIEAQMQERIARILALFASPRRPSGTQRPAPVDTNDNNKPRTPHLVLGSFGTGVFQNHVPLVARIFYDLLARRNAPFAGVFDTVVFAILGTGTVNVFRKVFSGQSAAQPQSDVVGDEAGVISGLELDGRVEVVSEGQDEDENALEMEEEVGCEEEGVLRVVESATTANLEPVSDVEDQERRKDEGEDGRDTAIDIDEVQAEATEIEMEDGTHDADEGTERGNHRNGGHDDTGSEEDVDVEMLDTADDVHVHPLELVDDTPTSLPTSP